MLDMHVVQVAYILLRRLNNSHEYIFSEYNCLKVEFLVARRGFGRYFMQVYLPIGITMAVTYLTLWLHLGWPTKVFLSGVGMMCTSILAAFASSLGPATHICTALDAWGFWSVVLSSLPMAVLLMSRLLTQKVRTGVGNNWQKVNFVLPL